MGLFAGGKQTDGGEGKLVEFRGGEEEFVFVWMSEVKGIPLFISADLAEVDAINIISRTFPAGIPS